MYFEIKEMYYSDKYGEMYIEEDFSQVIKDIILGEINKYNQQEEINNIKEKILAQISGEKIYFSKDIRHKEYNPRVKSIYSITKDELENVISDIREFYLYKKALGKLVDEGVLELIKTIPLDNFYITHASILIDIRHRRGNKCIYVYSDIFNKNEYKVLK